jgi:hypothetical protein
MKDDSGRVMNVHSGGYGFPRYRREKRNWLGLLVQNVADQAESRRRLKLTVLYCVGILLMAVGFLICFNAAYRIPSRAGQTIAVTSAETYETPRDSSFVIPEGGD